MSLSSWILFVQSITTQSYGFSLTDYLFPLAHLLPLGCGRRAERSRISGATPKFQVPLPLPTNCRGPRKLRANLAQLTARVGLRRRLPLGFSVKLEALVG